MQYSREVEEMVCVMKGPNHGPAPIPEEGKWVQAKEISDISGYTHGIGWCAPQQGACKLTPERQERRHRGSPGGDHRLLRHDPLRRHGQRDPARQDHPGSPEYRPGMRRDQHRHARTVPADRLRPHPVRVLRRRSGRSAPAWRTWARACAPGGHHVRHQAPRAPVIWKWPKATSLKMALDKDDQVMRLSVPAAWAR